MVLIALVRQLGSSSWQGCASCTACAEMRRLRACTSSILSSASSRAVLPFDLASAVLPLSGAPTFRLVRSPRALAPRIMA